MKTLFSQKEPPSKIPVVKYGMKKGISKDREWQDLL